MDTDKKECHRTTWWFNYSFQWLWWGTL